MNRPIAKEIVATSAVMDILVWRSRIHKAVWVVSAQEWRETAILPKSGAHRLSSKWSTLNTVSLWARGMVFRCPIWGSTSTKTKSATHSHRHLLDRPNSTGLCLPSLLAIRYIIDFRIPFEYQSIIGNLYFRLHHMEVKFPLLNAMTNVKVRSVNVSLTAMSFWRVEESLWHLSILTKSNPAKRWRTLFLWENRVDGVDLTLDWQSLATIWCAFYPTCRRLRSEPRTATAWLTPVSTMSQWIRLSPTTTDRNSLAMSKNVDALKDTSVRLARNVLQASTAIVRLDLPASAVSVRAATTKRTASSNQTIESSAIVVEDLAAATAKFKVKQKFWCPMRNWESFNSAWSTSMMGTQFHYLSPSFLWLFGYGDFLFDSNLST